MLGEFSKEKAYLFFLAAAVVFDAGMARAQSASLEAASVTENENIEMPSAPRTEIPVENLPPVTSALAPQAEGEIVKKAEAPPAEKRPERRGFTIAYEYGYDYYNEPNVMSEMGHLSGLNAAFEARPAEAVLMFRISGEFLFGGLAYDGALHDNKTDKTIPWTSTSNDFMYTLKAVMGLPAVTWDGGNFGPFVGVGSRYLNDQLQGRGSYEREISYLYLPLGLETRFLMSHERSLTLTAEYDRFLGGTVKSHLTDTGHSRDVENTQAEGSGYRVVADLASPFGEHTDLHIAPYYQHWEVGDSDKVLMDQRYWREPKNSTEQIGVVIGIGL